MSPRHYFLFACLGIAITTGAQIPKQGLSLWLKADAGVQTINDKVISWADQSGYQHTAVTKTTSHPRLVPNILSGHPVIRFDGFNNGMETDAIATFPSKRGSVFVVAKYTDRSATSSAGYGSLVSTYHGKRKKNVWQFGFYPETFGFYNGIGGRSSDLGSQSIREWQMAALVRTGDSSMSFYRGGRKEDEMTVSDMIPDTNTIKIGFNGKLIEDSIPEVLNGDIAEILIYDRALNEKERAAVHDYLSKKWGLALAAPPIWQRWWFYVLLLVVTVAVTIWLTKRIAFQKLKKRLQKLEKQAAVEAERYRISRDMHDEIGSGLTHIALLSELIQTQQKRDEELQKDVGTISASARKLVESMSEIIWTLNPQNDTLENLMAYLREQTVRYFEPFAVDYTISFPEDLPPVSLTDEERRNLFLTAKEAVHNALKHSGATKVSMRLVYQEPYVHFYIEDNGKGISQGKIREGANGLKIMERRMKDIGGTFSISTAAGGTVVHFSCAPEKDRASGATTFFTSTEKKR